MKLYTYVQMLADETINITNIIAKSDFVLRIILYRKCFSKIYSLNIYFITMLRAKSF